MSSPQRDMVAEFLEIVARFADTLVEMDLSTPEALAALAELARAPGFSRLSAAATEAWAVKAELIEPVPLHPRAVKAIRDFRSQAAHLQVLLSYSRRLPVVQDALSALWTDPTFVEVCHEAQAAFQRRESGDPF